MKTATALFIFFGSLIAPRTTYSSPNRTVHAKKEYTLHKKSPTNTTLYVLYSALIGSLTGSLCGFVDGTCTFPLCWALAIFTWGAESALRTELIKEMFDNYPVDEKIYSAELMGTAASWVSYFITLKHLGYLV
ncbi:MAG TPA: hypothetical protein VEK38_02025 [Candidatus Bathyarchaeia archaeon]|nr:hypothetical protein [Candidatus Bathyarchaeia archaeon]